MSGPHGVRRVHGSAFLLMGVMTVLVLGLASCAKEPEVEMQAARTALDEAQTSEAPVYAPDEWKAANDTLAVAQAEVDAQSGKFALFRSYGKSKQLYASAERNARLAGETAVRNKEQMRRDAEAALDQARQTIASTRTMMESREVQAMRRGKETREALAMIEAEVNAADSSLANVGAAMQQEQYKQALALARQIGQKANSLQTELQQAVEKRAAISGGR